MSIVAGQYGMRNVALFDIFIFLLDLISLLFLDLYLMSGHFYSICFVSILYSMICIQYFYCIIFVYIVYLVICIVYFCIFNIWPFLFDFTSLLLYILGFVFNIWAFLLYMFRFYSIFFNLYSISVYCNCIIFVYIV